MQTTYQLTTVVSQVRSKPGSLVKLKANVASLRARLTAKEILFEEAVVRTAAFEVEATGPNS
jgi:hypothetical protein